ncbi:hypothetical protein BDV26DRAFT_269787 [Aspergillus bertholletiae]|uniref:Uncharacterized protein n=1 Tax=Aspergillus bertholletiae TaxID=1226010 RepID=A0A5N7AXD9_9EURO|nr:hypothetical protein BDV26DRAFT_269787 [Aspergillus bertholletiae]
MATDDSSQTPSPDKQLTLRSATPSDSSPSKPFPEAAPETFSTPEWNDAKDAVDWFVHVRKVIKSVIYRYCSNLQAILRIFEENNAVYYTHYTALQDFLHTIWAKWVKFGETKTITTSFLLSSIISEDLLQPLPWIRTPRQAGQRHAERMGALRDSIRLIAIEMTTSYSLVQDTAVRLAELNSGHEVTPFPSLPTTETETDNSNTSDIEKYTPSETTTESDDEVDLTLKDPALLEENGFDPIWEEGEYPGEIPDDIEENLDSDPKTTCAQMIGSNKSIFWLFGYDELVDVIEDPGYTLEHEIVKIPHGTSAPGFLLEHYYWEGKLTTDIVERYLAGRFEARAPTIRAMALVIPSQVTDAPTNHQLRSLYPFCRVNTFPDTILAVSVKFNKRDDITMGAVRKALGDTLDIDNDKLWFRGLSLQAFELSLVFFIPVITTTNRDNEFGPGLYVADSCEEVLPYAKNGAIMVFKDPNFQRLKI